MSSEEVIEQQPEHQLAPHQPENQQEIDSRSVYVGNVDFSSTPNDVKEFFFPCGVVNRVTILYNKYTGRPKGYAYVEFESEESVEKAIELTGKEFKGRELTITAKRTNYPGLSTRPRGRGGFRGRGTYRGRGTFRGRGGYRGRGNYRGRGGYRTANRSTTNEDGEEVEGEAEAEPAAEAFESAPAAEQATQEE